MQYRETDFNFVSRLLEDEGIFYYFEQSQDKHTLVLANDNSVLAPCPNKPQARYLATTGSSQPEDTVVSLETEFKTHTGTASLTDYDFEKPGTSLYATLAGKLPGEDYDYPGKYKTKDDGARYRESGSKNGKWPSPQSTAQAIAWASSAGTSSR